MATLKELVNAPAPSAKDLASHLDALSPEARLAEVRAMNKADQIKIWELSKGARRLTLDDVVPASQAPMQTVLHEGKNSLPMFSHFSKVFCRPDDPALGKSELWGYNKNSALIETTVGPGYFVVVPHGDGELLVDYTRLPPRKPEGWSPILSNAARLSVVVYNHLQDELRGVSTHVTVGRATRKGKPENNYFLLCRMDP